MEQGNILSNVPENGTNFHQLAEHLENQPECVVTTAGPGTVEMSIKTLEETMNDLVTNEAVRANAVVTAKEIQEKFRNNWFTIDQLKKLGYKNFEQTLDMLTVLCFLELAYREEKHKGIIKYKITLSPQDKINLLKEELVLVEEQKEKLEYNIKTLESKLVIN